MNIVSVAKTISIAFMLLIASLVIVTSVTYADSAQEDIKKACEINPSSPLCVGLEKGKNTTSNPVIEIITAVINILTFAAGVLAVIFVIYSGFRFVSSSGEPQKVADARKTITYALVGIVVIVISRQLILFILSKFT